MEKKWQFLFIFFFFFLQSANAIFWTSVPNNTVVRLSLKANNSYWRKMERVKEMSFVNKDKDDEIPLIHVVRLMCICLISAQFIFLLHLFIRVFIPGFIKEDFDSEENLLLLVDLPKAFAEKQLARGRQNEEDTVTRMLNESAKRKPSRKAIEKQKMKNKKAATSKNKLTALTVIEDLPPPSVETAEDVQTCQDESSKTRRTTYTSRLPEGNKRESAVQSQRLPRAKKGHQKDLLAEMEREIDDDTEADFELKDAIGHTPEERIESKHVKTDRERRERGEVKSAKMPLEEGPSRMERQLDERRKTSVEKRTEADEGILLAKTTEQE